MVQKEDFATVLVIAILFGIFLLPTLIGTGVYNRFPTILLTTALFVLLPVLAAFGLWVASIVGKKIAILFQFAKFALVGFLNTSIDFGILNLLILFTGFTKGTGIGLINAPSFLAAILNSYFWNKKWVFRDSHKGNFFVFVAITLIGLLINTSIVVAITTFIPPIIVDSPIIWANIAKALATALSMVWNFTGYRLVVFKK